MYGMFEDEDDVFMGSPKSKLMDIIFNANNDVVRYDLEKFIQRRAAMELLLEKELGAEYDRVIENMLVSEIDAVENKSKSLCIELMGDIVSKSE